MSTISYIKESKAFLRYAADNGLSGPERELWHVLLDLFNERADGNQWPDGFLRLPNKVVLGYLSYEKSTLCTARNRLAQRGLIEFVPGERRADLPMYRMIYLTAARAKTGGEDLVQGNAGFCSKIWTKTEPKPVVSSYYDIDMDGTETWTDPVPPEESDFLDDEEESSRAREDEMEDALDQEMGRTVKAAFQEAFGRRPHRAEVRKIVYAVRMLGFDASMAEIAIRAAAEHGASAPAMYVVQVLNDLDTWGVYTPEDYDRHLYHYREKDVEITEQIKEANEKRAKHREVVRYGLDPSSRFFGDRAAETAEEPGTGGRAGPAGNSVGPGDGQPRAGADRQPRDAQARQGGHGCHPADRRGGQDGGGPGMGRGF